MKIPEVAALHQSRSMVRIPPSQDVPVSDRVSRIIDSSPMRRLASISQLGMVALVYPGATHSRLEHSLGVYHNAIKLLARFAEDDFIDPVEAGSVPVGGVVARCRPLALLPSHRRHAVASVG